ncbi:hypothetical protein F5146DRAFT_1152078 [Armillaria mellea]|nr:hypothetical protein F5146DRAFT_1152078 [Armillaria mellea]
MDFSNQSTVPLPYSVIDPLTSESQLQSSQSMDPALWANFNFVGDSILGDDEDTKSPLSRAATVMSSLMDPTFFTGSINFGEPLDTLRSRRASALPNGLISMDVPETEVPPAGTRGRRNTRHPWKVRAHAAAKHEDVVEEECRDGLCQVCKVIMAPREGTWQVCPKCTYTLLNRQSNPLFRAGGRAIFRRLYPEENLPASDVDCNPAVLEALYAAYLSSLIEEFALHRNDGLDQKELQPLIESNAAKHAYSKLRMKQPVMSEEVTEENGTVDLESQSELIRLEWYSPEEAGPSTPV